MIGGFDCKVLLEIRSGGCDRRLRLQGAIGDWKVRLEGATGGRVWRVRLVGAAEMVEQQSAAGGGFNWSVRV